MMEFRRDAGAGEWCSLLVPCVLWVTASKSDSEHAKAHHFRLLLSFFLALSSLRWARRIFHPHWTLSGAVSTALKFPPKNQKYSTCSSSSSTAAAKSDFKLAVFLLFVVATLCCGVFEAVVGSTAFALFDYSLPKTFETFRRSFTFGEGCVVVQSAVLYVAHAVVSLINNTDDASTVEGSFAIISKICLLSVVALLMLTMATPCRWAEASTYFPAYAITVFCGLTCPLLFWNLRRNPIVWIVKYVLDSKSLIFTLVVWMGLVIFAVAVVTSRKSKATTSVRKLFHLLVVIVFVSGVAVDRNFTCLASMLVLGIFVVVEYVRAFKIQPAAKHLDDAFAIFVDKKDEGALVLTNIYLLVGTFLPLWIVDNLDQADDLLLFSGILSVGVGDSAASIVGSNIGRWKISPSGKTVEGTLASVGAQLLFLCLLRCQNLFELRFGFDEVFLPICVISVVEALTTQVDNIVLPLILFVMFGCV